MSSVKVINFEGGKSKIKAKEVSNAKKTGYCSFCGRHETEVLKMVKGPGVNICSECTMIAVQYLILQDKILSSEAQQILDVFWGRDKQ